MTDLGNLIIELSKSDLIIASKWSDDRVVHYRVVCCALFVPKNKNFLCELKSSLYIDAVLFFFTFFVLFENIGEHASEANAGERKINNVYVFLPPPLPPCAGGQ